MAFQTPQLGLGELLEEVADGKLQLPDFQRRWKWDDEHIGSLLATVTLGYPMGVLMTLQTRGDADFKPTALSGVELADHVEPEYLLMDGQQRLTSLFQALRSGKPVKTMDARDKPLERWYYIDIEEAINPAADREDAILSVPSDRVVRTDFNRRILLDLSTREKELAEGMFPLDIVLDDKAVLDWQFAYVGSDHTRQRMWKDFFVEVLSHVNQYRIPVIRLTNDTSKAAVCTVFEKVNTGGVPLNVFELLTAMYAGNRRYREEQGEDFHLPEDWKRIKEELSKHPVLCGDKDKEPTRDKVGLQDTEFLQAVCLVATYHTRRSRRSSSDPYAKPVASCKRKDILELPLNDYLEWTPQVVEALHWAAAFLERQCVFRAADLPYRSQLVPLAAIRTVLGDEADTPDAESKLVQWYWCGVLGEQYGGSPESRLPRDLEQVLVWVRGGRPPESVTSATFQESRLFSLRSRNSAAYKGIFALLIRQGCRDWYYSKGPMDAEAVEDHQVDIQRAFPKDWCDQHGIGSEQRDSVVNRTLLSHRASRAVGNRAPSTYLQVLERESGLPPNWLDDVIASHLIDPKALRENDFDAFYRARWEALLTLIGETIGHSRVVRSDVQ